jgi:hypothetical protein
MEAGLWISLQTSTITIFYCFYKNGEDFYWVAMDLVGIGRKVGLV